MREDVTSLRTPFPVAPEGVAPSERTSPRRVPTAVGRAPARTAVGRVLASWTGPRTDPRDAWAGVRSATWVDEQVRIGSAGPGTPIGGRTPADPAASNGAAPDEMSART